MRPGVVVARVELARALGLAPWTERRTEEQEEEVVVDTSGVASLCEGTGRLGSWKRS